MLQRTQTISYTGQVYCPFRNPAIEVGRSGCYPLGPMAHRRILGMQPYDTGHSLTCQQCGKSFHVNPRRARNRKYCAWQCYQAAKVIPPEIRFWKKVIKTADCWLWNGAHGKRGHGLFRSNMQEWMVAAHRYSWELHFGPIPDGLLVCHHCDNPPCVRPDHLFLGTIADNVHDAERKGRLKGTKARLEATRRRRRGSDGRFQ